MADEKKYKYTVKRFAKMLTVHPDKRVTFQDVLDVRLFFTMKFQVGGPWHDSLTQLLTGVLNSPEAIRENETDYWGNIVTHGDIFSRGNVPVRLVNCIAPFFLRVEFEIPAATLAEWLAETGFPQMSRAKEEPPNAKPDVAR